MAEDKTILVVDDDPEICDALQEILSDYDYEVLTALDTVRAREIMATRRLDLLILDIMMATMDEGLNFAQELKEAKVGKKVPVLIVSARPPAERGYRRTIDEDMDWIAAEVFMEKPVDPEDLIHNVHLLLGQSAE